jgi:hypothetical protein
MAVAGEAIPGPVDAAGEIYVPSDTRSEGRQKRRKIRRLQSIRLECQSVCVDQRSACACIGRMAHNHGRKRAITI